MPPVEASTLSSAVAARLTEAGRQTRPGPDQTRPGHDLHGERSAVLPPGFGVGDDRELRVSKVDRERVLCVVRVAQRELEERALAKRRVDRVVRDQVLLRCEPTATYNSAVQPTYSEPQQCRQ